MFKTTSCLSLSLFLALTYAGGSGHHGPSDPDSNCLLQADVLTKVIVPELDLSSFTGADLSSFTGADLEDGHLSVAMMHLSDDIEPTSCPKIHAMMPLTVLVAVLASPMVWLAYRSSTFDKAEAARSTGLFIQFCSLTSYSIVIVQAYDLSTALGFGAAFSGEFIGMYFGATFLGALTMAVGLWSNPELWRRHPRHVLFAVQVVNVAGCAIYIWSALHTTYDTDKSPERAHTLSTAFLLARALSGVGQGISGPLLQVIIAHITPREDRPSQTMRLWFSITLGIGMGPVIAGTMSVFNTCAPVPLSAAVAGLVNVPRFELVGYAQIVLSAASVTSLALFYPSLEDVQDFALLDIKRTSHVSRSDLERMIVCGCLLLTFARAIVTSGVEAGLTMLLETPYDFPKHDIGFIIGATFLFCWPVKLTIDCCRQHLHVFQVIRVLCGACIVGSCLLLRHSWQCLIIAAVLLFPSLYLSDGLIRGVMQQYALPAGSYFDQTGTTLFAMVFNSSGRFMGPWIARSLLGNVSVTAFAALQVLLAALFWLMFEALIVAPARVAEGAIVNKKTPEVAEAG